MKRIFLITVGIIGCLAIFSQNAISLKQAKELAIKNNTANKNSALEIRAAQEVKKNAFTNYFPKVSATGFAMNAIDPLVKYNMPAGNLPVYDGNPANLATATQFAYFPGMDIQLFQKAAIGTISVTQPIFVGGKITNGNKLAKIGVEIKEKQQKLAENDILFKTEQQYWQIISLQEKQKTIEKYEILLLEIRKQVNDAYKSGLVVKNDLLRIQIKQGELTANKMNLQSGKKLALMQFCQTVGIPFDPTLVLNEDLKNIQLPQYYFVANEMALNNRAEYQLVEKSVKAQELQTKMTVGDYLPQLSVGGMGYLYNSLEKNAESTTNGLIFATVSIPISDWWGGAHAIKEQKIRQEIAANNFNDTKELLKLQMEKAWVDVEVNYRQILIVEETLKQTDENLKVSKDGYSSGVVTLSDLLEAQVLQTETTNKLTDAHIQYKLAVTNYLLIMGM